MQDMNSDTPCNASLTTLLNMSSCVLLLQLSRDEFVAYYHGSIVVGNKAPCRTRRHIHRLEVDTPPELPISSSSFSLRLFGYN